MIRRALPSIARHLRPQARSFAVASPLSAAPDDEEARRQAIRLELDKKTGRGWTDPWDLDELMDSRMEYDDLPDWSPDLVSRISQERLQVKSTIPSLTSLTELKLPSPPPPNPGQGQTKTYALFRQRAQYQTVREQVEASAALRLPAIQALPSWEDKQDAVDELFEEIEFQLKASNPVLGMHPNFGGWVEKALEEYLQAIQQAGKDASENTKETNSTESVPVFMDCYSDKDGPDQVVPSILHPLTINPRGTNGNMVEEWELAAHKQTKRIMIRGSTQKIAQALTDHTAASILVSGCQGVGKTAAMAAIVASARSSGYLVLYLPNGDQLHQNGFYVEPNPHKKGLFDLPIMSQRACEDFLKTHKSDMNGMHVSKDVIAEHMTKDQLQRLFRDVKDDSSQLSLSALLDFGRERINFSAPCLSAALDYLMHHQEEKAFLLAMDEFNCFYMPSHYFHADYDPEVKKAIPYDCISLFQPAMEAMALTGSAPPKTVKRGAVLAAVTESHAVTRATTDALVHRAKEWSADGSIPFVHIEVPRLSKVEVDHMLSNYEATGVGKLRLDRGETVANPQEVEYLRMVSGGIAGHLMNACMVE